MGGVEQFINQIATGGNKHGVSTDILSLTHDRVARIIEFDGYTVHQARLNFQIASTGFSASAFLQFSRLARKADVVHYHYPWPFMDLVHFATCVRKPTVVTYHSDIIRQKYLLKFYSPLKNKFLGSVNRIVATSPNYAATSDVLGKFADKVCVIPIGLDKETYPKALPERLRYWTDRLGQKFFLFIGVLRYYKGLHILIDAVQGTGFPIVIVGTGPIEKKLKERAAQLGLYNIHFVGHLPDDDKVALLTLCFGLVFPSHLRSEAFGISLLEGARTYAPEYA